MSTYTADELIAMGIAAARAGNQSAAREMLGAVVKHDETNVMAWWWLARVQDDPQSHHKCDERARWAAAQSPAGSELYLRLLKASGAALLPRYKLASKSRSVKDQCPICTLALAVDEEVILCPTCHRANHVECWEESLCHCGNFACDGSGLVDHSRSTQVEGAAVEKVVRVEQTEIPTESPWVSRETQEAGFVDRLRRKAAASMMANLVRRAVVEEMTERARRQALERQQQEWVRRVVNAFLIGLVPGIACAIWIFLYSHSWSMAIFTVFLVPYSLSTLVAHFFLAEDRLTSALYSLLPKALAAWSMGLAFNQWRNGLIAVGVAILVGLILAERILGSRFLRERRAFITYSLLGIIILYTIRAFWLGG